MGLFEALVLGIVQGLTEFLPISSSGHLVIVPALLDWPQPSLIFDATVHLATLVAVVAVFQSDIRSMIVAWWRGLLHRKPLETVEARLAWWVVLGTIPGVLVGILFQQTLEDLFSSPRAAASFLLVTALIMVVAELFGGRRREMRSLKWYESLLIGVGQAAAIAPGISRSGATISTGMYLGLNREAAARFSFILAIPIIAGAWLVQFIDFFRQGAATAEVSLLVVGFAAALVSGYLAIRFLLAFLRQRPLYVFAAYCVVAGILTLIFL